MYTSRTLDPSKSINWIIIFFILFGLMLTTITVKAQAIEKKVTFTPDITDNHIVKYFKVKEVSNKLYFKYLVLENEYNTSYTLESSSNGNEFYAVQLKEGFKSPKGVPLLYCYSVDLNQLNDKSFRIRRDSPDGVEYSSVIETGNSQNLSAQKN